MSMLRRALDYSDFVTAPLGIVTVVSCRPVSDLWALVGFGLGLVGWTLIEYAVHRALHMRRFPRLRRFHMRHHQRPRDATGGTLWSTLIILALVIEVIFRPADAPVMTGLLGGYYLFIVLHHAAHHGWLLARPFDGLAANHQIHHRAGSERMFGVTTAAWDRLFGTA